MNAKLPICKEKIPIDSMFTTWATRKLRIDGPIIGRMSYFYNWGNGTLYLAPEVIASFSPKIILLLYLLDDYIGNKAKVGYGTKRYLIPNMIDIIMRERIKNVRTQ